MKKKVLLSSILTIALCLSLIAGSTFALFTHSIELGIEATAGNVEIEANIENLTLWSVTPDVNGDVIDENKAHYVYEDQTAKDKFLNTGTAKFENNSLEIKKITPGDKVKFDIVGKNTGNIPALMRYVVELNTDDAAFTNKLAEGMVFLADGINYTGVTSYTSVWVPVAEGADMPSVTVELGLPVYAGNDYENANVKYNVRVEAVQGNAANEYDRPIVEVANAISDQAEFEAAMADPFLETVLFDADAAVEFSNAVANKTILVDGHDVSFTFKGEIDNVVIRNIVETTGGTSINVKAATGNITLEECKFISGGGTGGVAIATGPNANVTVNHCDFSADPATKSYAIYNSGPAGALAVEGCNFENFTKSWVIQVNNAINGDVVVNKCTFKAEKGVFKALYGVNGDFTFTNNIMIGCKGDDGNGEQLVVSTSKNTPITCTGTKTVSGNTLDGVAWTQQ